MPSQPYKYWSKDDLFYHLSLQGIEFGISDTLIRNAVYDKKWNPKIEYNGCNVVQDKYHPFLPCFIHDWRWICFPYTRCWDMEFKNNLVKCGVPVWKSWVYYFGVRCGWLFYYKWIKK